MDKSEKINIARQSDFIRETAAVWGLDPDLVAELHVWASSKPDSPKAFANVLKKRYYEKYPGGMVMRVNGVTKPASRLYLK